MKESSYSRPLKSNVIISQNILRLMEEQGKTRKDVCNDLGIKYTTFTDWVNGNSFPRLENLDKLAGYFGVSSAELLGDNRPKGQTPNVFDTLLNPGNDLQIQIIELLYSAYSEITDLAIREKLLSVNDVVDSHEDVLANEKKYSVYNPKSMFKQSTQKAMAIAMEQKNLAFQQQCNEILMNCLGDIEAIVSKK